MPIPLIVWGLGIGGSALAGVTKGGFAVSRIKKAKARYGQRRNSYEQFIAEFEAKHNYVSRQFQILGEVRLRAMVTLGHAVEFLEKAKLKDRELLENFEISPQKLLDWKRASVHALEVLGGLASSTASGVATAASAYGIVGMLASASTGTAISTLSGVAATNATLAWLGGGTVATGGGGMAAGSLVLGGLVAGPAIMVMGFVAGWKASKVEAQVEQYVSEMDVDVEKKRKLMCALDVVVKRVKEIMYTTKKTVTELTQLLSNSDPKELEDTYMVAKTAKTLGQLLEISILGKDGRIIEQEGE